MKEESNILEIAEGKQQVGASERKIWTIDTSNVATSPTSATVTAYDLDLGDDVTSTIFPSNTPSFSGNVITLDLAKSWTVGHTYVITVVFVVSTEYHTCKIYVECVPEQ